jgi:hypothetical protein
MFENLVSSISLHFYLWGYIIYLVSSIKIDDTDHLKRRIRDEFDIVILDFLTGVWQELEHQVKYATADVVTVLWQGSKYRWKCTNDSKR